MKNSDVAFGWPGASKTSPSFGCYSGLGTLADSEMKIRKPLLLWPKARSAITADLARNPDDFTVVITDYRADVERMRGLHRDTPIFDPFPTYGQYYSESLKHVTASRCRYHIVGLDRCRDVLRTLQDPSLSGVHIEEILRALGYLDGDQSNP